MSQSKSEQRFKKLMNKTLSDNSNMEQQTLIRNHVREEHSQISIEKQKLFIKRTSSLALPHADLHIPTRRYVQSLTPANYLNGDPNEITNI